ncbi:MAG TPA: hypothetical protein VGB77_12715 [Abditibacteriaceae bacterium]|jgi:hypothetical protein
MKYFIHAIVAAALLFSFRQAFAKAALVPLPEKIAQSDLIARVEVLSISKNEPKSRYQSIAKIKIIQTIKGESNGKILNLEFDNGLGCPNVLYAKGEDCLIFAALLKNGHYHTYNTYYGKFEIKKDKIAWWENSGKDGTPWNEVVAQIKTQMHETEPGTATK